MLNLVYCNFFDNNEELNILKKIISKYNFIVKENNRTEYGDFQTNINLANKVTSMFA